MSDPQASAALSLADARRRQQRAPCHTAHHRGLNSSGLAGGVILCARRALTRCTSGIPGGRSRLVAAALRDAVADVHHRRSARPKRLRAPLRPPHGGSALPGLVPAELACPMCLVWSMGRSGVPDPRRRVARGIALPGAGTDGRSGLGVIGWVVPSAAAAPGDTPLRAPPAAVWPAAKTLERVARPGWSRTTPRAASTWVTGSLQASAGRLTSPRALAIEPDTRRRATGGGAMVTEIDVAQRHRTRRGSGGPVGESFALRPRRAGLAGGLGGRSGWNSTLSDIHHLTVNLGPKENRVRTSHSQPRNNESLTAG
jgi:hypothetical protein